MVMQDTGLGLERSGKFVCVRVTSRPRSREQKQAFYCENLQERCGVRGDHLMVSKSRTATGGVTPDSAPRG
jgi:hypothetical protein